jgi:ferredoxin-NADP reductase
MGLVVPTTLAFLERRDVGGDVTAFAFKAAKPFRHVAGQHGLFFVPGAGMKAFSIASAPDDGEVLIGTKLASGSKYKTALASLKPGDSIKMRGPILKFTLDGSAPEVVFIAQGVGITPYRSMLRHLANTRTSKHTTLIHVAGSHAFRSDTEALAKRSYYPTDHESFAIDLKNTSTDRPSATFYLSGSVSFIKETALVLLDAGITRRQLKKDLFRGYPTT